MGINFKSSVQSTLLQNPTKPQTTIGNSCIYSLLACGVASTTAAAATATDS